MYVSTIDNDTIQNLPQAVYDGEIIDVTTPEAAVEAAKYLSTQKILGFDTETRPSFIPKAHKNKTALLQLSGGGRAYLIHLQMAGLPKELAMVLDDENIIKVGAAIKDDIRGLRSYSKIQGRGFVDLQQFVKNFGITDISVKKMAAIVLGVKVSKAQRLTNWESPVFTEAQKQYASVDADVCDKIFRKLKNLY